MGTGICLFWTRKMGFTRVGLGFNHWEWDAQFYKWEWDFSSLVVSSSFNFSRHIESVILTVVKFVLPDQRLQSPKVRCNFPLCNLKFVSFTKFWIMSLRARGVVRGFQSKLGWELGFGTPLPPPLVYMTITISVQYKVKIHLLYITSFWFNEIRNHFSVFVYSLFLPKSQVFFGIRDAEVVCESWISV